MISQQVSSLNCLQWLTWKCSTSASKCVEIRDLFCMQLFVYTFYMNLAYQFYTWCLWCALFVDQNWYIKNVYKMFECKMYPIFRQTLVYILHTKCIQNVYNMFVYKMYSTFQKNFACQMYTKCLHKTSIPHFHKRLQTFCMQNLAGIVFLILYTKCIQKFVERWYTFCIQFVYI